MVSASEEHPAELGAVMAPSPDESVPGVATRKPRGFHPATMLLEAADSLVYILVGICFFAAALFSLVYGLGAFAQHVWSTPDLPWGLVGDKGLGASDIIALVSDLLLTLIIMEVLGTVVHHLRDKETTLKPFLFIGIISATRGILAVGARLSVSTNAKLDDEFFRSMIELAINAAVIIALGGAMKIIGNLLDEGATPSRRRVHTHQHQHPSNGSAPLPTPRG
jgi:uncharacterized membrane protein (DUF373 family)